MGVCGGREGSELQEEGWGVWDLFLLGFGMGEGVDTRVYSCHRQTDARTHICGHPSRFSGRNRARADLEGEGLEGLPAGARDGQHQLVDGALHKEGCCWGRVCVRRGGMDGEV